MNRAENWQNYNAGSEIAQRRKDILARRGGVVVRSAFAEAKENFTAPLIANAEDFSKFGMKHDEFFRSAGAVWSILTRQYAQDALWRNPLTVDIKRLPIGAEESDELVFPLVFRKGAEIEGYERGPERFRKEGKEYASQLGDLESETIKSYVDLFDARVEIYNGDFKAAIGSFFKNPGSKTISQIHIECMRAFYEESISSE
jgi:uncharacterized protein (DUF2384 family)